MFERCFGCIPRRIGILVWGYIYLILSILWLISSVGELIMTIIWQVPYSKLGIGIFFISPVLTIAIMLLFIFKVHKILIMAAFYALFIFMMVTPFTMADNFIATGIFEQVLFSFKSSWFTTILLIGCHLKCRTLISLYYYAGLISCVESACTVAISVISVIILAVNPSSIISWPIYLKTVIVFLINVLLQGYMLLLVKKEINKYKINGQKYVTPTAPVNQQVPMNELPRPEGATLEGDKSLPPIYK